MAQLFCLMAVMAGLRELSSAACRQLLCRVRSAPPAGVCAGLSVLFHQHGHHQRCGPAHLCPLFPGGADTGRTEEQAVPVVVFQTVAANLGSMAPPSAIPRTCIFTPSPAGDWGIFWP